MSFFIKKIKCLIMLLVLALMLGETNADSRVWFCVYSSNPQDGMFRIDIVPTYKTDFGKGKNPDSLFVATYSFRHLNCGSYSDLFKFTMDSEKGAGKFAVGSFAFNGTSDNYLRYSASTMVKLDAKSDFEYNFNLTKAPIYLCPYKGVCFDKTISIPITQWWPTSDEINAGDFALIFNLDKY